MADQHAVAPSLVTATLRRHCPSISDAALARISAAWHAEADAIMRRMMDITAAEHGLDVDIQLRDELSFEFARLTAEVAELVVTKKLEERSCTEADDPEFLAFMATATGEERIENTARILAESRRGTFVRRSGLCRRSSQMKRAQQMLFRNERAALTREQFVRG